MSETDVDILSDTRTRLAAAIGRDEDDCDGDSDEATGTTAVSPDPSATDLLERAETDIEDLLEALAGRQTDTEEIRDDIDDLYRVIDESKELLDTIDHDDVAAAINHENISDTVEPSELARAILTGDITEAVEYGELYMLIEFEELLDAVEVTDFLQNKGEFEAVLEDFTEDREEDDDWIVFDMLKLVVERLFHDEEGSADLGNAADTNGADGSGDGGLSQLNRADDGEAKQAVLQSKLRDAIDEFRDSALDARERLKEARDRSKEQFEEKTGDSRQPSSQNPTAYSMLPPGPDDRTTLGGVERFSTVPETAQHSSAPAREHIYGRRFENHTNDSEGNDE